MIHSDDNIDLDLRLLEQFCNKILQRDYFIKIVTITNMLGSILVEQRRTGGTNLIVDSELITAEESKRAAAQAAIRAATRDQFRSKIGDLIFSISRYEKEVRATIPICQCTGQCIRNGFLAAFPHGAIYQFSY